MKKTDNLVTSLKTDNLPLNEFYEEYIKPNMTISQYLIVEYGFTKLKPDSMLPDEDGYIDKIDFDQFTAMKRVHEVHYLFYSDEMKYFTIGYKLERKKGQAGGGYKEWNYMVLPTDPVYTTEDADKILSIFQTRYSKLV